MTKHRGTGNQGIIVTGGTFTAGQVAVGRRARAYATVTDCVGQLREDGHAEVAAALDRVLLELQQHVDELESADELVDSARAVGEELTRETPNKRTLMAVIDSIAKGVGSVGGLAVAVQKLSTAVAAIF
jgi:translation initiation factor 2B subunit (eIF-2B alpha/beta/delta family)